MMGSGVDTAFGRVAIVVGDDSIQPEVFRLCDTLVDDVILVSDDEICSAIRDVFVDTRAVLEPAGATSIAGAKKYYAQHGAPEGTSCVAVASDAASH